MATLAVQDLGGRRGLAAVGVTPARRGCEGVGLGRLRRALALRGSGCPTSFLAGPGPAMPVRPAAARDTTRAPGAAVVATSLTRYPGPSGRCTPRLARLAGKGASTHVCSSAFTPRGRSAGSRLVAQDAGPTAGGARGPAVAAIARGQQAVHRVGPGGVITSRTGEEQAVPKVHETLLQLKLQLE